MAQAFLTHLRDTLAEIEAEGLMKTERLITSPQGTRVGVDGRRGTGGARARTYDFVTPFI